jgi:antitoxin HigA-1
MSPEMAIRLAKALGGAPQIWASLQLAFDMAHAMRRADQIDVQRIALPARAA